MLRTAVILATISCSAFVNPASTLDLAKPPVAPMVPEVFEVHGERRIDNYFWLRDRNDPAVLSYLNAENAYAANRLAPLQPLINEIDQELRERTDRSDAGPSFTDKRFVYHRRIARGASHPVIVRQRLNADSVEQIVLDLESIAAGQKYFELANYVISPDGRRVAYAVDFTGARTHRIFVRDIATGAVIDTGIDQAASDLAFSADSDWLFLSAPNPVRCVAPTVGPRNRLFRYGQSVDL